MQVHAGLQKLVEHGFVLAEGRLQSTKSLSVTRFQALIEDKQIHVALCSIVQDHSDGAIYTV